MFVDGPTAGTTFEHTLNPDGSRFEGTVLLVTHDQDLMEEVGTRVWHFDIDGIRDFKGSFEEYEASLA
jgi:ATPase subunit of ABC transporter with duplicated ATPase domains